MTLSIIGSGNIGSALARQFARRSLAVSIANSRGGASLASLAAELGPSVKAVGLDEALQADTIILALPFPAVPELAHKTTWAGRIVIDATNAIDKPGFTPTDLGGRLSSEVVAETLAGARVVKAFNTLPAAVLGQDPEEGGASFSCPATTPPRARAWRQSSKASASPPWTLAHSPTGGRSSSAARSSCATCCSRDERCRLREANPAPSPTRNAG